MKILISDYDSTFNPIYAKLSIQRNTKAIENFRKKGNIFILSSFLTPSKIQRKLEKSKIPFDYLICDNGNLTFDERKNIIQANYIDENEIESLIEFIRDLYEIKTINYLDPFENPTLNAPYQIRINTKKSVGYNTLSDLEFDLKIKSFLNQIHITHNSNLRNSIVTLLKELKLNLEKDNIYSLGNSIKDSEMLKSFNGYKIPLSNPYLILDNEIPLTEGIYTLIKKL